MRKKIGLLIAAVIIVTILTVTNINQEQEPIRKVVSDSGYSVYEASYTLDNGYFFPCILVCNMKDRKLEKKINKSLTKYFYMLEEGWFNDSIVEEQKPIIHLTSPRYLSVEYIFKHRKGNNRDWHFCVNVDVQSGKVIFFDDLVSVNDNFAKLVKYGRILRKDAGLDMTAQESTDHANGFISEMELDYIKSVFSTHTREYREEDYAEYCRLKTYNLNMNLGTYLIDLYTNYFYLEEDNICFSNVQGSTITKIRYDDLDGYLKVSIP